MEILLLIVLAAVAVFMIAKPEAFWEEEGMHIELFRRLVEAAR